MTGYLRSELWTSREVHLDFPSPVNTYFEYQQFVLRSMRMPPVSMEPQQVNHDPRIQPYKNAFLRSMGYLKKTEPVDLLKHSKEMAINRALRNAIEAKVSGNNQAMTAISPEIKGMTKTKEEWDALFAAERKRQAKAKR